MAEQTKQEKLKAWQENYDKLGFSKFLCAARKQMEKDYGYHPNHGR